MARAKSRASETGTELWPRITRPRAEPRTREARAKSRVSKA